MRFYSYDIRKLLVIGGERGIRTPERVAPLTVFETAAFGHSAISPQQKKDKL